MHNALEHSPVCKSLKGKGPRTKKAKQRLAARREADRAEEAQRTRRELKLSANGVATDTRPKINVRLGSEVL